MIAELDHEQPLVPLEQVASTTSCSSASSSSALSADMAFSVASVKNDSVTCDSTSFDSPFSIDDPIDLTFSLFDDDNKLMTIKSFNFVKQHLYIYIYKLFNF